MKLTGETDLKQLLKTLKPKHIAGDYVFCVVQDLSILEMNDITMFFREEEGITVILKKDHADQLRFDYSPVFSWITLTVHSSLKAVGLTAAFSKALADQGISCNVVAGYYHDHIFVNKNEVEKAMNILSGLSEEQLKK